MYSASIIPVIIFFYYLYMLLVYFCVLSSDVYLYFRILMYVKRHEHFEIGCGAVLNKIYYYYSYYVGK